MRRVGWGGGGVYGEGGDEDEDMVGVRVRDMVGGGVRWREGEEVSGQLACMRRVVVEGEGGLCLWSGASLNDRTEMGRGHEGRCLLMGRLHRHHYHAAHPPQLRVRARTRGVSWPRLRLAPPPGRTH